MHRRPQGPIMKVAARGFLRKTLDGLPCKHGARGPSGAYMPKPRTTSKTRKRAPGRPATTGPAPIDPLAMTVAQAAKVLSAVGLGTVTEELIRRHIAAGAPAASDGRINLVHYAAWLNLPADHAGPMMDSDAGDARAGNGSEDAGEHGA